MGDTKTHHLVVEKNPEPNVGRGLIYFYLKQKIPTLTKPKFYSMLIEKGTEVYIKELNIKVNITNNEGEKESCQTTNTI